MLEQELRRALGCLLRRRLSGRDPVLVQPPHRRQRLVERGAVARRLLVAVPAAVRPLPLDERLREQPDARIVGEPEPAADRERVPLLRAAPPDEPVDRRDPAPVALPGQPREHGLGRGDAAGLAGGDAELDERDEPPVRAAPLGVDVDAEAAVGLLPREQRAYLRPFEDVGGLRRISLPEQVALRLEDDPRLVRVEQPVQRRCRHRHVSSFASKSSSSPSASSPSSTIRGTSASANGRRTTRSPRNSMTVL